MSAYVVSREHIQYLIEAALHLNPYNSAFSWYWNHARPTLRPGDELAASEAGQMLWNENCRSVDERYPDCKDDESARPGPVGCDYLFTFVTRYLRTSPDPVAVLKAIAGYSYQACETDDWQQTQAWEFIHALRLEAIESLPGYDAAEWAISEAN